LGKNICFEVDKAVGRCYNVFRRAGVAQLVEQLICNQQVGGSSPSTSSNAGSSIADLYQSLWEISRVAKGGRL
jgi:hypothetical protein